MFPSSWTKINSATCWAILAPLGECNNRRSLSTFIAQSLWEFEKGVHSQEARHLGTRMRSGWGSKTDGRNATVIGTEHRWLRERDIGPSVMAVCYDVERWAPSPWSFGLDDSFTLLQVRRNTCTALSGVELTLTIKLPMSQSTPPPSLCRTSSCDFQRRGLRRSIQDQACSPGH